jgi:hypothetical protein
MRETKSGQIVSPTRFLGAFSKVSASFRASTSSIRFAAQCAGHSPSSYSTHTPYTKSARFLRTRRIFLMFIAADPVDC